MLQLRPYQAAATRLTFTHLMSNPTSCPLVVLPTGSGKSVVIADFIKQCFEINPKARGLMVTHVQELVEQNALALMRLVPNVNSTIFCASLGQSNLNGQVICGSIQSLKSKAYDIQQCNFILIDEAHLVPFNSDTMYRKFIQEVRRINPNCIVIGYTATPYRMQGGHLCEGDNAIFDAIAYEKSVLELIEAGYLSPLVTKETKTALDVSGVKTIAGDFAKGALEAAINIEETTKQAVQEIIEYGYNRRSWLVFAAGVEHAYAISVELSMRGISCAVIEGNTSKAERASMIAQYKSGEIKCLIGMNVLTTGFDAPATDLIACLRPTKSAGLWVQILGRGLRISPSTGKKDCLVLDFGGNSERHGPLDQIRPPEKRAKRSKALDDGLPKMKGCPNCHSMFPPDVVDCPDCGYVFENVRSAPEIDATASTEALFSTKAEPKWLDVEHVTYSEHRKRGAPDAPPTMRVDYECQGRKYSEWVCLQHPYDPSGSPESHKTNYARNRAVKWCQDRGMMGDIPNTVEEGILCARQLRRPSQIIVKRDGKYDRIENYQFTETEPEVTYNYIGLPPTEVMNTSEMPILDTEIPF